MTLREAAFPHGLRHSGRKSCDREVRNRDTKQRHKCIVTTYACTLSFKYIISTV